MAITGDDVTLDEIIPISYDFSVVEGTTELFSQISMLLWSIIMVLSDISTVSSPDELAVVGECFIFISTACVCCFTISKIHYLWAGLTASWFVTTKVRILEYELLFLKRSWSWSYLSDLIPVCSSAKSIGRGAVRPDPPLLYLIVYKCFLHTFTYFLESDCLRAFSSHAIFYQNHHKTRFTVCISECHGRRANPPSFYRYYCYCVIMKCSFKRF